MNRRSLNARRWVEFALFFTLGSLCFDLLVGSYLWASVTTVLLIAGLLIYFKVRHLEDELLALRAHQEWLWWKEHEQ